MSAFAGVLAIAAFTAWAPEVDACVSTKLEGSPGTVESVREVALLRDLHAFEAETAEELVVRLDAGPLVVFTQREAHRLSAGQRVRVQLNGSVARVERDSSACATPLAYGKSAP